MIDIQIVTHNNAATIEATLQSVSEQTYRQFHIMVIDNASNDDTVQQVRGLGVDVYSNLHNLGYAAAHNQGLQANSRAPYVLTLNPDVWLAPQFLQAMVTTLDSDSQIGAAAGCLLRVEQLGSPPTSIDSTGIYIQRNRRQRLRFEGLPVEQRPTHPTYIFGPDGAAAFYRRAMLDDIQLGQLETFDSDFFMHKEDVDICWRAQLRGWRAVYVPDAIAHHVRHFRPGYRANIASNMRRLAVQNRYLLMLKNEVPAHFWRDCPSILAYDLRILVYLCIFERHSLPALWSAWKLRHRIISKRKLIQQNRTVDWRTHRQWFRGMP